MELDGYNGYINGGFSKGKSSKYIVVKNLFCFDILYYEKCLLGRWI